MGTHSGCLTEGVVELIDRQTLFVHAVPSFVYRAEERIKWVVYVEPRCHPSVGSVTAAEWMYGSIDTTTFVVEP